jgi:signal transduction histidine kinase
MAKQTAFDVIDSAVVVFGPSGKLVDMNRAAQGYSAFMPFENMYQLYGFFTDTDCMSPVHGHQVTKRLSVNGEDKYFSAVFHKIADLGDFDRSCIAGITDVTEHHRLAMMQGEQERLEQKRVIIGDIHDGISGNVTVISMLAGQEFENEAEMREALHSIGQISADAAQDIRLMMGAYDRESVTLDQLSGDMRYIGGSYTTGRNISFSHSAELGAEGDRLVDFGIYVNLVHFFKECVVNTVKHSSADTVQSFLSMADGQLIIEYCDNGVGLKDKKSGGYGLSTMRKRIDNIGGELTFADENGLRIRAVIPFQR